MAEAVQIIPERGPDLLDARDAPALNATSDMPMIEAEPAPAAMPDPGPAAETPPEEAAGTAGAETGEAVEEAAAESEAEAEATAEPPKPARKPGISERFSDLTAARKAAEAKAQAESDRAERAERLLEEALARVPKPDPTPEPVVEIPPPDPRPVRETYDTPDEYDAALIEWSAKRALQVSQAERAQHEKSEKEAADRAAAGRAQDESIRTVQAAYTTRRNAALEKFPDYAEVAEREDLRISLPMSMAIMQSEDGPAAAYYLGKNPALAEKITDMVVPGQVFPPGHQLAGQPIPDVQRQLIEMGKVFAAVAEPASPPPPPERPAPPPPITPIRSRNAVAVNKSLEEIGNEGSMEDYAARRLPELRAERRTSGILGGGRA